MTVSELIALLEAQPQDMRIAVLAVDEYGEAMMVPVNGVRTIPGERVDYTPRRVHGEFLQVFGEVCDVSLCPKCGSTDSITEDGRLLCKSCRWLFDPED